MNKCFSLHPKYKMLRNIVLVFFALFFYSKTAWSLGNCNGDLEGDGSTHAPIAADITNQRHNCQADDRLIVQSGVTIRNGGDNVTVLVSSNDDDVTIENYGTIHSNKNQTIKADGMIGLTINNYNGGTLSSTKSSAIYLPNATRSIRINNYEGGTIESGTYGTIFNDAASASDSDIYIHNEGLIRTKATNPDGCSSGSAPYEALICRSAIGITGGGGATTIVNTATGIITYTSASQSKAGIKVNDSTNATITNYGEISGASRDIYIIDSGNGGTTTINLGGTPTFENGIDINLTTVNIVLQNDISGVFSVNIYDKDSDLSINDDDLPANYAYSLTTEDLDSDLGVDDGILSIVTVPILSSSSPADGASNVGVNDNIILTFSEAVDAESGNIVIKKSSDDSIVETIDVTGSKVSGSGSTTITVDPSTTLDQATGYYITIDATAFDNASSVSYAGISDATTLNFNTGASDPLADKDVVGSIEAQVDVAKQIIHHSTIPVLDRMEWLRRHKEENDLSHQGIKVSFANPMYTSISDALPVSTYFNPTAEVLPNNWAIWTKGSVTIGKTSGTDLASLKDIESTGITIGSDKKVGQDLVHGFALRFGRDDVDVGSSGTSLDTDSYSLSIYRTRSYNEKTFLDSLLGISILKTDLIRKSGANTLTGSRNGKQIFGSLSYSGVLKKDQFNLSPSVRLDAGYTTLSDYSETGKDALTYDTQKIKTGKISTGVLLDDTFQFSSATLRPNARLEYGADFSPSSNAVLSYVSDPNTDYTLSVKKEALHNFRAGVGLDIETVGGLSVTTFYERNEAVHSGYSDTMRLGIEQHLNTNIHYALSYDGNTRFNLQITSDGFNVNFKLEYSVTDEIPHQLATLSLVCWRRPKGYQ